ncbi:hypothetical protein [Alteromonas gracilis]|uniref:hypothetical protein n=1 Tax=Alteromonas gracilis TaxID=1479524 RepID=UPI0030CC12A3
MKSSTQKEFEIGKLGVALCLLGLVGFIFAIYFNAIASTKEYSVIPRATNKIAQNEPTTNTDKPYQIGPIDVDKPYTAFEVYTAVGLPANHWTFVEIEVVNHKGDYLYSFGQELWHETGRDSDGNWTDVRYDFDTDLTFPETGKFFLNFMVSSKANKHPSRLKVRLTKRNGSAMLHFWTGLILIISGLFCIEIQYGIFRKTLENMNYDD